MRKSSLLALFLFLACTACSSGNKTNDSGKQVKLAFVTNNSADFCTIARRGVEKADEELPDVTAEFRITQTAPLRSKLQRTTDSPKQTLRVAASWSFAGRLVAFPNPLERFGHCLKLHSLIHVARGLGKDKLVRISLGLQHF
jgi:hypothetical protein